MKRVVFHPQAEDELAESEAFYESRVVGLGPRFALEVERTTARIRAFPNAGRSISRGLRKQFVAGFPYEVIYRASVDQLFVLAVAHQSRRPGYWRARARRR